MSFMIRNIERPASMTVYSISTEYSTILIPSTSPKSYELTNTSPFSSIKGYNKSIELEKVELLLSLHLQWRKDTWTHDGKVIRVVVSNMADPPNYYQNDEEMLGKLDKGQFWFRLVIKDLGITKLASFDVRGFERRGDMRLEIEESCSRYEYQYD
jgi:hypothetical protein